MTNAKNAFEKYIESESDGDALVCGWVSSSDAQTIRRALRLLAAVEAGTHKVVPMKATAENGMKYKLIGEFRYDRTYTDDYGDERDIKFELTWPETKEAYDRMLQAAPDFFAEDKP